VGLFAVKGDDDRALKDVAASGAGKGLGCLAEAFDLVQVEGGEVEQGLTVELELRAVLLHGVSFKWC
jgi:hypothetical protein